MSLIIIKSLLATSAGLAIIFGIISAARALAKKTKTKLDDQMADAAWELATALADGRITPDEAVKLGQELAGLISEIRSKRKVKEKIL